MSYGIPNPELVSSVVRTILIVEDDADLRQMFRTALAYAGFRVREAGNGFEALRMIDSDPPDLVVLDLGLPVMSGEVVRQEIAAQAHTRHIPIVIVTGSMSSLEHLGVACVLRKPVSPDALIETVGRCLTSGAPPQSV
jgi:CheY-like chemotaxis protein